MEEGGASVEFHDGLRETNYSKKLLFLQSVPLSGGFWSRGMAKSKLFLKGVSFPTTEMIPEEEAQPRCLP